MILFVIGILVLSSVNMYIFRYYAYIKQLAQASRKQVVWFVLDAKLPLKSELDKIQITVFFESQLDVRFTIRCSLIQLRKNKSYTSHFCNI